MKQFNVPHAQQTYGQMYQAHCAQFGVPNEATEAILFAKALQLQNVYAPNGVRFCSDREFFVAPNPAGYAVTGYCEVQAANGAWNRVPFNFSICKQSGLWYPTAKYVGADTKAGTNFLIIWLLLMLGCTLIGLLSYYIMSAAIGF